MRNNLPKTYDSKQYEDKIYRHWEDAGFFNPDKLDLPDDAETFTIVLPPPNVTGTLHMGHAGMLAIEDIMIRYHRMQGKRALWVPGTDHAAIATQTKVEKLVKEEGQSRHSLGREKFLERVRQYARESHDTIINQCKKMGASLDWSREAYTLDETRNKAVNSVFKMMYEDGLIYRGERIVNWCPRCHSVLADDEVEYKEEQAKLYWLKYGPFVLATSRPETKLGDTAVAVHPDDKRYKDMVGKKYMIPGVLGEFEITVVADRAVDPEFGSGAIKVTPAHSFVDAEIAERHGIPSKKIIDEDGRMRENCGKYAGMSTREARQAIVEDMKKMGLIDHIDDDYAHRAAICYRCDTVIEPLPSKHWFINVNKKIKRPTIHDPRSTIDWNGKSIKDICLEVVREGKIKIIPERFSKNYFHWMENLRDWCVSRQIWFGHRVPVWYKGISDWRLAIGDLHFRDRKMFDLIKSGEKTVETRYLNPGEEGRYFGDIKEGDVLRLQYLADDKLKEELMVKVKRAAIYKNTDEMLDREDINKIWPGKNKEDLLDFQKQIPGYQEKIEKNGIIAFEIERIDKSQIENLKSQNQQIHVGLTPPEGPGWTQDEDTLDTWFSSGMWTFSTLARSPEEIRLEDGRLVIDSGDFRRYHPTQVLETGYDILFFWVARMIIMTTYAIDQIPFENVYLHGLVLDEKGKKMSKSKGNVIDPLDMIDKYGTDATRLSLVIGSTPGNDLKLGEEKVAGFRNLVNKIWNVGRYILQTTDNRQQITGINNNNLTLSDKFILAQLDDLVGRISKDLAAYRFSGAGELLREFTWTVFADWYIEATKFQKGPETDKVLVYVLNNLLKLWHPFVPFVTEAIWQKFNDTDLIIEEWPKPAAAADKAAVADFNLIKNIITAIRNARAENKVEPGRKVKAVVYAGGQAGLLKENEALVKGMRTGVEEIEIKEKGEKPEKAIFAPVGEIEIYLLGAVDEEKEKKRLQESLTRYEQLIKMTEDKLADKNFVERAPEPVVDKERQRLEEFKLEKEKLAGQLGELDG